MHRNHFKCPRLPTKGFHAAWQDSQFSELIVTRPLSKHGRAMWTQMHTWTCRTDFHSPHTRGILPMQTICNKKNPPYKHVANCNSKPRNPILRRNLNREVTPAIARAPSMPLIALRGALFPPPRLALHPLTMHQQLIWRHLWNVKYYCKRNANVNCLVDHAIAEQTLKGYLVYSSTLNKRVGRDERTPTLHYTRTDDWLRSTMLCGQR